MNSTTLYALLAFCLVGTSVTAGEGERHRFLVEAPKQWLEYRRIVSRHTAGHKTRVIQHLGEEKSTESSKYTFIVNLDRGCVRVVSQKRCEAYNPKYRFRLAGGEGKWIIRELRANAGWRVPDDLMGRNPARPLVMYDDTTTFGEGMAMTCTGLMLSGGWLPLMVSSPCFKLLRVTDLDDGELVKVDFEFEPKEKTGGGAPARSGMVILDTKRYWLIRKAETEAGGVFGRGTLKISNDFGEFMDGTSPVPFVSHQVIELLIPKDETLGGKRVEDKYVLDIGMYVAGDQGEKECMLSAFGLPEPGKLLTTQRQWWIWLLVVILAVLVCVFVARRSAVRKSSRSFPL